VAPLGFICSMTGRTLAAKRSAFALLEAMPRRCACFSFGPPSFTPRRFRSRERRLGAGAYCFTFVPGHSRQNMKRELVRKWHIGGNKLDAAFHQLRNESYVPGEPVELGHHEPRLQTLASGERGGELWPIVSFAALHLNEFLGELPISAIEEVEHGLALSFKAKTTLPLPVCRDAKIRNPFTTVPRHIVLTSKYCIRWYSLFTRNGAQA
jgi:hypothetical protein